jgi:hypothetical protein
MTSDPVGCGGYSDIYRGEWEQRQALSGEGQYSAMSDRIQVCDMFRTQEHHVEPLLGGSQASKDK